MYTVHMVGLMYFYHAAKGRRVLLPDGANPGVGVPSHYCSFFIQPEDLLDSDWWDDFRSDHDLKDAAGNAFTLTELRIPERSVVTFPPGTEKELDTSNLETDLAKLLQMDPTLDIKPETADTIAQVPIERGTLRLYAYSQTSVVQYTTDLKGDITITVTPEREEGVAKYLKLRGSSRSRGTEIVFANAYDLLAGDRAAHAPHHDQQLHNHPDASSATPTTTAATPTDPHTGPNGHSHFKIYGKLDRLRNGSKLRHPAPPIGLASLPFSHQYLEVVAAGPETPTECSSTCC